MNDGEGGSTSGADDRDRRLCRRPFLSAVGGLAVGSHGPALAGSAGAATDRSADAQAVLEYLRALSDGTADGVIAGQNCGHGDEIAWRYPEYVEAAEEDAGELIGLVGLDYEYAADYSAGALREANEYLIDHWNRGGLVSINVTPNQPFSPEAGHSNVRDTDADVDLRALIDPDTTRMAERPGAGGLTVNEYWMEKLDRIGVALAELRDAGVVVLWRPMQEPDGFWFWYGTGQGQNPAEDYVAVWRHMYDYFTEDLGLDNLLWMYSSCGWGRRWGEADPYPGAEYVDLVAPTAYNDDLSVPGWDGVVDRADGSGGGVGIGEYGPDGSPGDLDTLGYLERAREDYPEAAFWINWHSWNDENQMALVHNENYVDLLRHEAVVTAPVPWDETGGPPPIDETAAAPTDPDDDGVYEDLNANERVDSDDVVTYFEHYDEPVMRDHVDAYDLNGNDRLDADDVVQLFEER